MSTVETPTRIRLNADSNGMRLAPAEFDAVTEYDPCYRYELIDGIVIVNPIPLEAEAEPNEILGGMLFVYKQQHPEGNFLDLTLAERYLHLPNGRRRVDRVIWAGLGRRPAPKIDVPTIAVEFVSAGRRNWERDYVTKREEYLTAGVQEYWIIDRFKRSMTVHTTHNQQRNETVILENGVFSTNLLPGFELPLCELLAAADKWDDQQ